jgi:exodeoxyribonuclease VII small subunit
MSSQPDRQEPTFEQARAELERIVSQLEAGEAGLEDAIRLWERGEALYRLCLAKLDAAQGRVEQLGRELADAGPRGEHETASTADPGPEGPGPEGSQPGW